MKKHQPYPYNVILRGVVLLLPVIMYLGVNGQSGERIFEQINTENGLSSNYTNCIIQDSKGFIWMGTNHGLNRFDGYNAKLFLYNEFDSVSISNNWINCLLEDSKGRLWVGTEGGGLNLYEKSTGKFKRLQHDPKSLSTISSNVIICIFEDRKQRIWVGTQAGFCLLNQNDYTFECWNNYTDCEDCNHSVSSIADDAEGNLWIADEIRGLYYFNPDDNQFINSFDHEISRNKITSRFINDIFFENDILWIGGDNGVDIYDRQGNEFLSLQYSLNDHEQVFDEFVISMRKVKNNGLLISTNGSGLYHYNLTSKEMTIYRSEIQNPRGLSSNTISDAMIDRSDNLWIATRGGGLNKFNLKSLVFKHWRRVPDNTNSLINNEVRALHEDENGDIWIGTNNGLSRFIRSKNIFRNYSKPFGYREDKETPRIRAILRDNDEILWVATQSGGVYRYLPNNDSFVLEKAYMQNELIKDKRDHRCIYENQNGVLWLGGTEIGIVEYQPKTKKLTRIRSKMDTANVLVKLTVNCIIDKSNHEVWLGSETGLVLLNTNTFEFKIWRKQEGDQKSLVGDKIRSLYQQSDTCLWIGTRNGLSKFNPKTELFSQYKVRDGLSSDVIFGIVKGSDENIWLTTPNGLTRFNPSKMDFRKILIPQNNTLDMGAYTKGIHSEIIVGGTNGFTVFNPKELKNNPHVPNVVFTDFRINNLPIELEKEVSELDTIVLTYKQNNLTFEFSALEYTSSEDNRYRCFLEGFDESWMEYANKHDVTYTNLDPGEYTLHIQGSNNDATWNDHATSILIIITPPWWSTWWFRTIFLFFIIVLTISIPVLRIRNLRLENEKLERKVRERTKQLNKVVYDLQQKQKENEATNEELAEAHDELKTINDHLDKRVQERTSKLVKANKELDRFVYSASHDISSPLKSLHGLINLILFENTNKNLTAHLEHMQKSVNKMEGVIHSLAQYSRNSGLEEENTTFYFDKIVNEVLDEVNFDNKENSIEIIKTYDAKETLNSDFFRIKIILSNLISNAIKYRKLDEQNSHVQIGLIKQKRKAQISIKDNGIGIEKDYLDHVFNMFYRASEQSKGSGLGLYIVKETIDKLGGNIDIKSSQNQFTEVIVTIPN